jgi:phosphoglycolate phosphatase
MNFFFFDLDGTLEDSRIDMANAVNMVRESVNLELRDVNVLKENVNKGMHELYMNCFDIYFLKQIILKYYIIKLKQVMNNII